MVYPSEKPTQKQEACGLAAARFLIYAEVDDYFTSSKSTSVTSPSFFLSLLG